MVNAKDKRDELEKSGVVYSMRCNDCDQVYVGETARNAKVRAKEHRALARNGHPELSPVDEQAQGSRCGVETQCALCSRPHGGEKS